MYRLIAAAVAASLFASPAFAETCIVDYETFEVRELLPTDHSAMPDEQSMLNSPWRVDMTTVVAGDTYEKYGLPREVPRGELEFHGFRDSVPFMKAVGDGDGAPEVLYALTNAWGCEVQPYTRVP